MSKVTSKPGTMLYPVPTVMVSCSDGEKDNIITIGWSGIVNSEPPMTYVSVRKSRFSHHLIQAKKEFVINLVNEDLVKAADFCGVRSGENLDKWKEMNLHREKASIVDVIEVFMAFSKWMQFRMSFDDEITPELLKTINKYHDLYINELLQNKFNQ